MRVFGGGCSLQPVLTFFFPLALRRVFHRARRLKFCKKQLMRLYRIDRIATTLANSLIDDEALSEVSFD